MAIDGTNGNDTLTGTVFADTINGFDGDDMIDGGGSADTLNGGAGNDTFRFSSEVDLNLGETINGGAGIDRILLEEPGTNSGRYDFSTVQISSIEVLEFGNSNTIDVSFYASRIGSGLSSTATIIGPEIDSGARNATTLQFYMDTSSLDLSNLIFQQWDEVDRYVRIGSPLSLSSVYGRSISGTQVSDEIGGSSENDIIRGNAGNDRIWISGGADELYGGEGDDEFKVGLGTRGSLHDDVIDGGAGTDRITIGRMGDFDFRTATLRSIEEIEFINISKSTVIFNSSQLGSGLSANATIDAQESNYRSYETELQIHVDTASTDLTGLTFQDWEDENDEVVVFGSNGSDTVRGTSIGDTMYGYSGGDVLHGFGGTDTLIGGTGDDQLFGGRGNDIIESATGTNTLFGGRGNDVVTGGNDVDTIYGNIGADRLFGNEGDDALYGGGWSDRVYGGDGDDTIHGNRGNDRLFGDSGNDTMTGGHGRDFIDGGSGNDQIHGNGFADELHGGSGDDSIYGDAGSDIINGGGDSDSLWGGDGRSDDGVTDRFVFESSFGEDRIRDFENGIDKIDFAGNATFNDFATVSANATQSGGDILITQDAGNTLTIEDMNLADLDASDFIF